MKLVMDEKLKHRLIGLAVIISLGAIFAPAVMKKSSQHIDNDFSVSVKLPPKPLSPDVVMTDEKDVFKTIKIAKVDIPAVSDEDQLPELAKAQPVKSDLIGAGTSVAANGEPVRAALNQAAKNTAKNTVQVAALKQSAQKPTLASNLKPASKNAKVVAKAAVSPKGKAEIYAVQLASFSQLSNAQALVNKLHAKGYKANFIRIAGKHGPVYKVYAGHSPSKVDVLKMKTQLASAMQLNGFVVNTGVS